MAWWTLAKGAPRLAVVLSLAPVALGLVAPSAGAQARCPADLECWFDQVYKQVDGLSLTADVYRRAGRADLPAVLLIHGGAWQTGTKAWMTGHSEYLARHGFLAVNVDYRLAPCGTGRNCSFPLVGTARYGDQYADVRDALLWVRRVGSRFGGNGGRIGVFGTSAGGHLAGLLNYRGTPGGDRADGAVSWAGPFVLDLRELGIGEDVELRNAPAVVGCGWGSSPECTSRWIEQSVTTYVDRGDPPMRIVQAVDDPRVREFHAQVLAQLLDETGVPHELKIWERGESCTDGSRPVQGRCAGRSTDCGATHTSFSRCRDLATGLSEREALVAFFARVLAGPPADGTPPVLTVPSGIAVDATGPSGAAVRYSASATDDVDPNPVVSCSPPSGAIFAIGTTLVTCTATDAAGNVSTRTFRVVVNGASEQIGDLIALVRSFRLGHGTTSGFTAKLEAARAALDAGDRQEACGLLRAFANHTRAQSGKKLTATQANRLMAAASRIGAVLSCGS